jgi:hypothetical protein
LKMKERCTVGCLKMEVVFGVQCSEPSQSFGACHDIMTVMLVWLDSLCSWLIHSVPLHVPKFVGQVEFAFIALSWLDWVPGDRGEDIIHNYTRQIVCSVNSPPPSIEAPLHPLVHQ